MRRRALILGLMVAVVAGMVQAQTPAELIASKHILIRAWLEPETVFVGQPAELKIQVFTKTWFLSAPRYPEVIAVDDAVVLPPGAFGVNSTERVDGETYAAQTRTFRVFPVAPGQISIPPIEVTLVVARKDASRSDEIVMRTPPLTVEATLPEAARGRGLVIAVPRLEVEEKWSRSLDGLKIGHAVSRTVIQRVERSVAMVLPAPRFEGPEGIAVYPQRPVLETDTQRGALTGRRVDEVTYVCEREGEFVVPGEEIAWWDLGANRLRVEVLADVTVTVEANPELAADHLEAPEDLVEDVETVAEAEGKPWWRAVLIGLLIVALLVAALSRLRSVISQWLHALRRPQDEEGVAFRALRAAVRTGDPSAVLTALYCWRDAMSEIPGPPTLEALFQLGDDEHLENELRSVLKAAAGRSQDWNPGKLMTAVDRLRRLLHQTGRQRPLAGRILPSLNPRTE
ncbi:MAG: protein BatD [bacterium]|nr:protein BatD [bacterium]